MVRVNKTLKKVFQKQEKLNFIFLLIETKKGGDGSNGKPGLDGSYDQVIHTRQEGNTAFFEAQGKPGGMGGHGGKGGAGGIGGYGHGYSVINYRQKNFKKSPITDNGLNGAHGSSGQPGMGGKYGDTAVRKVVKNKSCTRRGGPRGWFGSRICHIDATTLNNMSPSPAIAASGEWRTTWNAINQNLPTQLNKINAQSYLVDEYNKFSSDSVAKSQTFLSQAILNANDTTFIKQVLMQS
jgi:hypothetical protein